MRSSKIGLVLSTYLISNCLLLHAEAPAAGIEFKIENNLPGVMVVDEQNATVKTIEFTSSTGKYKIKLPDNWEMKQDYMGLDLFAVAPLQGPDDQFRENFNILFTTIDKKITLDEYYNMNVKYLEKLLTDFKMIDQGVIKISGHDARWIKYSHRMGEVNATMLQYLFIDGSREFVITFAASPDDYSKYDDIFKQIASSFEFTQ